MKLREGNMWVFAYEKAAYFIFTGNSVIKNNGALVMGSGMAKQVRDRIPGIDLLLGKSITQRNKQLRVYGFVHNRKIGVFQTKIHYNEKSSDWIITQSTESLCTFARHHKDKKIHMNYPGIGLGGLTKEVVLPIIKQLPDNVYVWSLKEAPKCHT